MYDETLRNLKEQFNESQDQVNTNLSKFLLIFLKGFFLKNQRLTLSLQGLQGSSKDTRDKLSDEVCFLFFIYLIFFNSYIQDFLILKI